MMSWVHWEKSEPLFAPSSDVNSRGPCTNFTLARMRANLSEERVAASSAAGKYLNTH